MARAAPRASGLSLLLSQKVQPRLAKSTIRTPTDHARAGLESPFATVRTAHVRAAHEWRAIPECPLRPVLLAHLSSTDRGSGHPMIPTGPRAGHGSMSGAGSSKKTFRTSGGHAQSKSLRPEPRPLLRATT
jgi:hypothetical protein